jgi:5-azacytidine-induced protein 1
VEKLKSTESKYASRFKTMQEGRDVELARQKEILAAAEKMRREKWVKEQTRKIKEMTIKGIEPEILRMVRWLCF